ncbi:MAG: hypothetical protein J5892_01705 [Bacilli bacterium]|nr:hypothetical protein [Bacilli bacterium]
MNNFLEFINNDIETKKTTLQSMPTNNKTNVKKYNAKIESIEKKYDYYKDAVLKYINAKSESFECGTSKKDDNKQKEQLEEYKRILKILNPSNTYVEKLGFDSLFYEIHNYASFTFEDINNSIGKLVDIFKKARVNLTAEDFKYTYFVYKYMSEFLKDNSNLENLNTIFEKIYWYNPNIIEHIELNFRKLIVKYQKSLECYLNVEKKKIVSTNKFEDYEDFFKEYQKLYNEIEKANSESIGDIIEMAKNNDIDINNYFPDSKFRITVYSTLTINEIDYGDPESVNKLLDTLRRLKNNVIEYSNYLKFKPLFDDFKNTYEKVAGVEANNQALKKVEKEIANKEAKLESINKKIFGKSGFSLFGKKPESTKNLKLEQVNIAKELYTLYYEQEKLKFENKIINMKKESSIAISDVLKLYYSYDYFKREEIQKAFALKEYNEINDMCYEFDKFAANPNNIIVNGIEAFNNVDVANIIYNKYRLENINLEENDLDEDSLEVVKNKIDFMLRINAIENSKSSIEKIWFIVQNEKINAKEAKSE